MLHSTRDVSDGRHIENSKQVVECLRHAVCFHCVGVGKMSPSGGWAVNTPCNIIAPLASCLIYARAFIEYV